MKGDLINIVTFRSRSEADDYAKTCRTCYGYRARVYERVVRAEGEFVELAVVVVREKKGGGNA